MRDRIAFKVIERTGPMFGVAVLVEEASLREYALALLQYFSTPRQRRTSWLCTRRRTLKQPWAAEPVGHRLRASGWCDQLVPL